MRKWRVGTFSMGLLLIIIGVVLLASLISGFPMAEVLFKWWPVLLIILGVEILAYIYFAKEDHPKIKYDVFSMFMIIVICSVSFGAYTVASLGVLPRVKAMIAGQDRSFSLEDKSIEIPADVNKLILELSNASFNFTGHKAGDLRVFGSGEVYTDSQENIEALINADNIITRKIDNTIIIQFKELPRVTEFNQGVSKLRYTVVLPANLEVELKRPSNNGWQRIELEGAALNRNMIVDNSGPIVVNAGTDTNLTVEATMKDGYQLSGNVEWVYQEESDGNKATLKIGDGKYKLYLFNRGEIEFKYWK